MAIRGGACGEPQALIRVRAESLAEHEAAPRKATELKSLQRSAQIAAGTSQAGHANAKAEAEEAMQGLRRASGRSRGDKAAPSQRSCFERAGMESTS
eukprot:4542566-Pyramimonas_sp.AAC.1